MGDRQPLGTEENAHNKIEEQERLEILEEIDQVVETNRLPVSEDMSKLNPRKKGIAFPLLINLFAISAVIATFYLSNRLFEQKQEDLSIANATYQSAEGKLLAELKKESEEKLKEKDAEIDSIQDELAELDKQSRELAASMEQQISDRENELRKALEEELEQERQKLRSQGRTEADIEAELLRLEQERSAQHDTELAAFKDATQKAIAEKEEELARAKQLNEELLAEVNSEKARIETETQKRESELTAEFEAEKAALAEEAADAAAQLEQLTKNQAQESLIIDQINGSYENIFNLIKSGSYENAEAAIIALRQLIEDPAISELKSVKDRSSTDHNMLNLLNNKIEEQTYKQSSDSQSLAQAADLLLSAREIAKMGEAAYAEGNLSAAEDYYTRSLNKIPSLKKAWEDLDAITSAEEKERLATFISKGNNLMASGELDAAAQEFASAAVSAETGNPALLNSAVEALKSATETQIESISTAKDTELSQLENRTKSEIEKLINELSTAEKDYTERLSSAEAGYQEELDSVKTGYEIKLEEASSEYTDLETAMNKEIDRLSTMIGERDQENLRINAEKEEKIVIIEKADARISELQESLEQSGEDYNELNERLTALQTSTAKTTEQAEDRGYQSGYTKGRYAALEDIIDLTAVLGGTSTDIETEKKVTELAEKEDVYGRAVQEITRLASSGLSEAGEDVIPVKQNILIGSVSYASGNSIIIETLTDIDIETGTRITIYRKERGKEETYITFGIVTSVSGDGLRARTDPSEKESVRSLDLVYITR